MEVHYHPDIRQQSKSWKEYIIEFFLIFLAVTMGFFAEKIREHIGDKKKEIEFINSLKEDLIKDMTNLSLSILNTQNDIRRIDSFVILLNIDKKDTTQINNLYFYARNATRKSHFQQTERTIIQLNNSGNFRFIKDTSTVFNLLSYEKDIDNYKINASNDGFERNNLDPFISKIFDNNVFVTMLDSENIIHKPLGVNKLKSYDKDFTNQIIYYINQLKGSYLFERKLELNLKNKAKIILEIIQKNYSLS